MFREICLVGGEDDGLKFLPETVRGKEIREDQEYDGVRIQLESRLVAARIILQIDIGFGDAVVPDPIETQYPTLLDFSAPRIRVYPREVVSSLREFLIPPSAAISRKEGFEFHWHPAGPWRE